MNVTTRKELDGRRAAQIEHAKTALVNELESQIAKNPSMSVFVVGRDDAPIEAVNAVVSIYEAAGWRVRFDGGTLGMIRLIADPPFTDRP